MCGKKNRFIGLAAQPVKQLHHLHFTGEIEKCRRFVQKDHRSLLCQRFGNHHFLSLTITQGMHHAVCQVLNLHQSNGTFDHLLIFSAKCSPKPVYGLRPKPTSSCTVILRISHFSVSTTLMTVDSSLSVYASISLPTISILPPI